MDKTLEFILNKYNLDRKGKLPLIIKGGRYKELTGIFKGLNFKVGVEIGVLRGRYSKLLCQSMPKLKLYSVDSWKAYKRYGDWKVQKKFDVFYKEATLRLSSCFNCTIIKKTSMEAVKDFKDGSLDFVFIDGNHSFEYVTNDIAEWSHKVRKGGIISGHDFARVRKNIHVKDVVQGWTYSHGIKPWFIIKGVKGDRHTSWMWVKE